MDLLQSIQFFEFFVDMYMGAGNSIESPQRLLVSDKTGIAFEKISILIL